MTGELTRIVFPAIFSPIAATITILALVAFLRDLILPNLFSFDPLFLLYGYMGFYVFSAAYEAVHVFRGMPE